MFAFDFLFGRNVKKGRATSGTHVLRSAISTANSVPTCSITLKNKFSCPIPAFSKIKRCPDDEIGKNSLNPCAIPKTNASQISIDFLLVYSHR